MVPASILALVGQIINTPVPLFNMICTNVPGPRIPLYILGKQVTHSYPYVPVGYTVGLSAAIFSYNQKLFFGLTADAKGMPDLAQHFEPFLEESFRELEKAAGLGTTPPKVPVPAAPKKPAIQATLEAVVTLPEMPAPEVALPKVELPEVVAPEMVAPEIPVTEVAPPESVVAEVALPEMALPEVAVAEVTTPEVMVAEIPVTEVTVPEVALPEAAIKTEAEPPAVVEPETPQPEIPKSEPEVLLLEATAKPGKSFKSKKHPAKKGDLA
jgi:hypothetical protein